MSDERIPKIQGEICDRCCGSHPLSASCGDTQIQYILEFEQPHGDEYIEQLKKTVQLLRDEKWQLKKKYTDLSKVLVNFQQVLPTLAAAVKRLRFNWAKTKAESETFKTMIKTETQQMMMSMTNQKRSKCMCDQLRKQNQDLQVQLTASGQREKNFQKRVHELTEEIEQKNKQAIHRNKTADQDHKSKDLQKLLASKENELKNAKKDMMILQKKVDELQGSQENTKKDNNTLKGDMELLCRQKKLLEHELEILRSEKETFKNKKEQLEKELKNTSSKMEDAVANEVTKRMKDLSKVYKQDLQREKERLEKEMENQIVEYREHATKTVESLKVAETKHKEGERMWLEKKQRWKEKIKKLKEDLKTQQEHLQRMSNNSSHSDINDDNDEDDDYFNPSDDPQDDVIVRLTKTVDYYRKKVIRLQNLIQAQKDDLRRLKEVKVLESLVEQEVQERSSILGNLEKTKQELLMMKSPLSGYYSYKQQTSEQLSAASEAFSIYKKKQLGRYSLFRPQEAAECDLTELHREQQIAAFMQLKDDAEVVSSTTKTRTSDSTQDLPSLTKPLKPQLSARSHNRSFNLPTRQQPNNRSSSTDVMTRGPTTSVQREQTSDAANKFGQRKNPLEWSRVGLSKSMKTKRS